MDNDELVAFNERLKKRLDIIEEKIKN